MTDYPYQQPIVPSPQPQDDSDERQLRILAIFHYVVAGFNLVGSLFGLVYLLLGFGFFSGTVDTGEDEADRAIGGIIFTAAGAYFFLGSVLFAALLAYTALNIRRQRHWTFCFVMAILSCVSIMFCACGMPNLGVGIFSLIVLSRPSVKARFGVPARPNAH